MELAISTCRFLQYVSGLATCIKRDGGLTWKQAEEAKLVKNEGLQLFAPEKGGSYEVFNERPLQPRIEMYCVQDVMHMPKLWQVIVER